MLSRLIHPSLSFPCSQKFLVLKTPYSTLAFPISHFYFLCVFLFLFHIHLHVHITAFGTLLLRSVIFCLKNAEYSDLEISQIDIMSLIVIVITNWLTGVRLSNFNSEKYRYSRDYFLLSLFYKRKDMLTPKKLEGCNLRLGDGPQISIIFAFYFTAVFFVFPF